MKKTILKAIYYIIVFIMFGLYLILLGMILGFIFDFFKLPDSAYLIKQITLVIVAFLFVKPVFYTCIGWIALKMGLTNVDFIKSKK